MKIAYFTHYFPPVGFAASVNTFEIVRRLAMRGHQLLVYGQPTFRGGITKSWALYAKDWLPDLKVHYSIPTPLLLSVTVPHIFNLLTAMKGEYDLVITQFHAFHLASFPGYAVKALRKRPWIVKVQDLMLDPSLPSPILEKMFTVAYYRTFLNVLSKKADKTLVLTNRLKHLLETQGIPPERVAVMPHGVDTNLFSPSKSKEQSRTSKNILYIGSMRPQYGLEDLVRAFALLKPNRDLRLILIGQGPDRTRLSDLTRKLGLERNVEFLDYVPHGSLPEIIRRAYVTVGPLRSSLANYYTIPTKALEYFACEKTIVSTEVAEDVLIDGQTGLVMKKTTPESLAEKLSYLIEDEKLAATLGKNARQLVVEKFDWEKIIDSLERELREATAPRF
jgi:colanic acid biosynthesis glycosyl transferase WcaI